MNRRSFLLSAMAMAPAAKLLRATVGQVPVAPIFEDVTAKSGVRFKQEASRTSQKYLPESMVDGVAMFDYDNDGWLDLFFVNGAKLLDPMPRGASPDKSDPRYWNRLYKNNRDGTFIDVTEKAGLQDRFYAWALLLATTITTAMWIFSSPIWPATFCTIIMAMGPSPT